MLGRLRSGAEAGLWVESMDCIQRNCQIGLCYLVMGILDMLTCVGLAQTTVLAMRLMTALSSDETKACSWHVFGHSGTLFSIPILTC